ncbi:MAG TPA: PIN domain-containing protein [Roseiarcus sp.]|nr:PIN domain-containing protein [Roseiarcus sp.]
MKPFLDTNIFIYAQEESARGDRARAIVADGGIVSVQILNELASVLRRKLKRSWSEVAAVIDDVRTALDEPLPLTLPLHLSALEFARDHNVAFYDALILAAAIEAGCEHSSARTCSMAGASAIARSSIRFSESPPAR